jgi:hypothetical protein
MELAIDDLLAKKDAKVNPEATGDQRCTSIEDTYHNSEHIFNVCEGSFHCSCAELDNI